MKVLYQCFETSYLNDIECRYHGWILDNPQMRYGELPANQTITYTTEDKSLLHLLEAGYFEGIWITEPIFKGKRKMDKLTDWELRYVPRSSEYGKRMKWTDFNSVTKVYDYREIKNPEKFTLSRLMRELQANEFIEFCKDRGLGVIPVEIK